MENTKDNSIKRKALLFMHNEKMEDDLIKYAENYGYEVVHSLVYERFCENHIMTANAFRQIMELYDEENFDTVIVSNFFQLTSDKESFAALCILLSDYNISVESTRLDEGSYGTNFIFQIRKVDTEDNSTFRKKAVIFLNESYDDDIEITEKKLVRDAIGKGYEIVNTINFTKERISDDTSADILQKIIAEREQYEFDVVLFLNSWQITDFENTFASVGTILSDNDITLETLYKGGYSDDYLYDVVKLPQH